MKDSKIIQIRVIGGLGNQMFCYAFYEKMRREHPDVHFILDISEVWDRKYRRGAEFLEVFPEIEVPIANPYQIFMAQNRLTFRYRGKGSRVLNTIIQKINGILIPLKKQYAVTEADYFNPEYEPDFTEIRYFEGFWQNIDFYIPLLDELRQKFTFREIEEKKKTRLETVQNTNSVSVHIRRGDYVGEILDILDTDYYRNIIQEVQREQPDAHFYLFSNDAEYVKKEYAWLKEKTIVDDNTGANSFRDLQLMSLCRTNIIANSTFSIWAALLNRRENRKVYYPSLFCKGSAMQDIHLPGFIKVDV